MELQMVFYNLEECENCLTQINTNLNLVPPSKWDNTHRILNEDCEDYLNGLRYYFLKPSGGRGTMALLDNVTEVFNYVELEFNSIWDYIEPEPEPEI